VKPIKVHDDAITELHRAIAYYEEERAGLGSRFREQFEAAITKIRRNPLRGSLFQRTQYRSALFRKFPYVIFYMDREHDIYIAAISHSRRRPGYWIHRRLD